MARQFHRSGQSRLRGVAACQRVDIRICLAPIVGRGSRAAPVGSNSRIQVASGCTFLTARKAVRGSLLRSSLLDRGSPEVLSLYDFCQHRVFLSLWLGLTRLKPLLDLD